MHYQDSSTIASQIEVSHLLRNMQHNPVCTRRIRAGSTTTKMCMITQSRLGVYASDTYKMLCVSLRPSMQLHVLRVRMAFALDGVSLDTIV